MPRDKSREWLESLLAGHVPVSEQLKQLPIDCPTEGLYFDYKAGKLLTDKGADPAGVLRQYIAAFANADGGFLVVGYDQKAKQWDGARPPGASTLAEWAASVLTSIPQTMPRISTSVVDGNDVLLIAVNRSRSLVPVVEKGAPAYYLRLGDQTLAAPAYLVSDLMLGRRNEPQLSLTEVSADIVPAQYNGRTRVTDPSLRLSLDFENVGLAFASDVRAGLVAWSIPPAKQAPSFLQQCVDVTEPPETPACRWVLAHARLQEQAALPQRRDAPQLDLGPFDVARRQRLEPWPIPLPPNDVSTLTLAGALYLVARDATPWWFQIACRYDLEAAMPRGDLGGLGGGQPEAGALRKVKVAFDPCYEQRPQVCVQISNPRAR